MDPKLPAPIPSLRSSYMPMEINFPQRDRTEPDNHTKRNIGVKRVLNGDILKTPLLEQQRQPEPPGVKSARGNCLNNYMIGKQISQSAHNLKKPSIVYGPKRVIYRQCLSNICQVNNTSSTDNIMKTKSTGLKRRLVSPAPAKGIVPNLVNSESLYETDNKHIKTISNKSNVHEPKQYSTAIGSESMSSNNSLSSSTTSNIRNLHSLRQKLQNKHRLSRVFSSDGPPVPTNASWRLEGKVLRVHSLDGPIVPSNGSVRFGCKNSTSADIAYRLSVVGENKTVIRTPKTKKYFWSESTDSRESTPSPSQFPKRMFKNTSTDDKSLYMSCKALVASVKRDMQIKTIDSRPDSIYNYVQQVVRHEKIEPLILAEEDSLHEELIKKKHIQDTIDESEDNDEQYELHDLDSGSSVQLESFLPELKEHKEIQIEESEDNGEKCELHDLDTNIHLENFLPELEEHKENQIEENEDNDEKCYLHDFETNTYLESFLPKLEEHEENQIDESEDTDEKCDLHDFETYVHLESFLPKLEEHNADQIEESEDNGEQYESHDIDTDIHIESFLPTIEEHEESQPTQVHQDAFESTQTDSAKHISEDAEEEINSQDADNEKIDTIGICTDVETNGIPVLESSEDRDLEKNIQLQHDTPELLEEQIDNQPMICQQDHLENKHACCINKYSHDFDHEIKQIRESRENVTEEKKYVKKLNKDDSDERIYTIEVRILECTKKVGKCAKDIVCGDNKLESHNAEKEENIGYKIKSHDNHHAEGHFVDTEGVTLHELQDNGGEIKATHRRKSRNQSLKKIKKISRTTRPN